MVELFFGLNYCVVKTEFCCSDVSNYSMLTLHTTFKLPTDILLPRELQNLSYL